MSRTPRILLLLLCSLALGLGDALKVPLRMKDVLPVLPRQISWPVLNNFHSAVDLLPSFIGSVTPNNLSIQWEGACFSGNEARLEFTESDRDKPFLGGGVLYLKVRFSYLKLIFFFFLTGVVFNCVTCILDA